MQRPLARLANIATVVLLVGLCACQSVPTAQPGAETWSTAGGVPAGGVARESQPSGGPVGWDEGARTAGTRGSGIFTTAYRLYSRHLTAVDGPRCEHRPTCSRFAYEAVQHHGFVLGSFLA